MAPQGLTGLKVVRGSNQSFDSNSVNFCPIFKIFFLLKACVNRHLFKPEGRAKGRRRRLICEYFFTIKVLTTISMPKQWQRTVFQLCPDQYMSV